jgi:hypothetical protein
MVWVTVAGLAQPATKNAEPTSAARAKREALRASIVLTPYGGSGAYKAQMGDQKRAHAGVRLTAGLRSIPSCRNAVAIVHRPLENPNLFSTRGAGGWSLFRDLGVGKLLRGEQRV